jgi:hypothetical protein
VVVQLRLYRVPSAASKATLRGGDGMPKMVVTHGVVDVEKWLSFKAERAEAVAATGVSNAVDLAAQDGSNAVAIMGEADDPAAVMAALASPPPEVAATMERHGVVPPLTIYIEK